MIILSEETTEQRLREMRKHADNLGIRQQLEGQLTYLHEYGSGETCTFCAGRGYRKNSDGRSTPYMFSWSYENVDSLVKLSLSDPEEFESVMKWETGIEACLACKGRGVVVKTHKTVCMLYRDSYDYCLAFQWYHTPLTGGVLNEREVVYTRDGVRRVIEGCKPWMNGGLIFHSYNNTWSINT